MANLETGLESELLKVAELQDHFFHHDGTSYSTSYNGANFNFNLDVYFLTDNKYKVVLTPNGKYDSSYKLGDFWGQALHYMDMTIKLGDNTLYSYYSYPYSVVTGSFSIKIKPITKIITYTGDITKLPLTMSLGMKTGLNKTQSYTLKDVIDTDIEGETDGGIEGTVGVDKAPPPSYTAPPSFSPPMYSEVARLSDIFCQTKTGRDISYSSTDEQGNFRFEAVLFQSDTDKTQYRIDYRNLGLATDTANKKYQFSSEYMANYLTVTIGDTEIIKVTNRKTLAFAESTISKYITYTGDLSNLKLKISLLVSSETQSAVEYSFVANTKGTGLTEKDRAVGSIVPVSEIPLGSTVQIADSSYNVSLFTVVDKDYYKQGELNLLSNKSTFSNLGMHTFINSNKATYTENISAQSARKFSASLPAVVRDAILTHDIKYYARAPFYYGFSGSESALLTLHNIKVYAPSVQEINSAGTLLDYNYDYRSNWTNTAKSEYGKTMKPFKLLYRVNKEENANNLTVLPSEYWARDCTKLVEKKGVKVSNGTATLTSNTEDIAGIALVINLKADTMLKYAGNSVYTLVLNSAPTLSGTDADCGDQYAPCRFTIKMQDTDLGESFNDGDSVTVKAELNGELLESHNYLTNAINLQNIVFEISEQAFNKCPVGTKSTMLITAEDKAGAKAVRTYTFTRRLPAPTVTLDTDKILTEHTIKVNAVSTDKGQVKIEVAIDRDVMTLDTEIYDSGSDVSIVIPKTIWRALTVGGHSVTVSVKNQKDLAGKSTIKEARFTKKLEDIEIKLKAPVKTDAPINKIMIVPVIDNVQEAEVTVKVTNDALSAEPVWEEFKADFYGVHEFTNSPAEASEYGFNVLIHIKRKKGSDMNKKICFKGFGGSFL